ncbi:MAG: O-antigen ligase family protein [Candidatus Omnitrophota bacterium]
MSLAGQKIIIYCDRLILFSLCLVAYFIPISRGIIEGASIAAIFCYIVKKFLQWQDLPHTPLNLPVFSYLAACILSMFLSTNPGLSAMTFFFKALQYIAFFFVVADTLNTRKRFKIVLVFLFASSLLTSIDGIFQYFTHRDFLRNRPFIVEGRASAAFATPNDLGCYLISVLPFFVSFSFIKSNKSLRLIAFIGSAILLLLCLLFTVSKSAWYGFMVFIMFTSLWLPALMFFFLAGIIILLALPQSCNSSLGNRIGTFFLPDGSNINDAGTIDRKMIWRIGLSIFKSRPLIGLGLGTFMFSFTRFAQGAYPYSVPYAHNCYLQMAAEMGIIGLLSFLSILALFFFRGIMLLNSRPKTFSWHLVLAGLGSVLAYSVQMAFDTSFYSVDLGILFWFMLGIGAASLRMLAMEPGKAVSAG